MKKWKRAMGIAAAAFMSLSGLLTCQAEPIDFGSAARQVKQSVLDKDAEAGSQAAADQTATVLDSGAQMVGVLAQEGQTESSGTWAQAYLDVLKKYKERILLYDWQDMYYRAGLEIADSSTETGLNHVLLKDCFGDSTPELIFGAARLFENDGDWTAGSADIMVFTYDGTKAVNIMNRTTDYVAGGGGRYALVQCAGSKNLFFYESSGDENWTYSWTVYSASGNSMTAGNILRMDTYPDYEADMTVKKPYKNGASISEYDYLTAKSQIIQSIDTLLMYNYADDEELARKLQGMQTESGTYRKMEAELSEMAGQEQTDPKQILKEIPDFYEFTSGAGGWSTELTLYDDGTFEGNYHDSDANLLYLCSFFGKFTDFAKVDENTYSMRLETLNYERPAGEEWTEENALHCISAEAYGLEGGSTFYIYLLGHPLDDLPEGFLSWANLYMGTYDYSNMTNVMNIYGIYNVDQEYGFGSSSNDVYKAVSAEMDNEAVTLDDISVDVSLQNSSNSSSTNQTAGGTTVQSQAGAGTNTAVQQGTTSSVQQPVGTTQGQTGNSLAQLLPESSSIILTDANIAGMTSAELQTAINEIYARHGYAFHTPEILAYFKRYSWYTPAISDQQVIYDSCSAIEKQNIEFLRSRIQ